MISLYSMPRSWRICLLGVIYTHIYIYIKNLYIYKNNSIKEQSLVKAKGWQFMYCCTQKAAPVSRFYKISICGISMDFQESAYWGCFLAEMPFLGDIWLFCGVVSRLVPAKTSSMTIFDIYIYTHIWVTSECLKTTFVRRGRKWFWTSTKHCKMIRPPPKTLTSKCITSCDRAFLDISGQFSPPKQASNCK